MLGGTYSKDTHWEISSVYWEADTGTIMEKYPICDTDAITEEYPLSCNMAKT